MNVAVYERSSESHTKDTLYKGYIRPHARYAIANLPSVDTPSFEGPVNYTEQASESHSTSYSPSIEPGNADSKTSLLSMADFPSNTSVCSAPNDVFSYGYALIACT